MLRQSQARQGLTLRADITARQQSMKTNLARAQQALGQGDLDRASRYRGQAEGDIEALEKFLGR